MRIRSLPRRRPRRPTDSSSATADSTAITLAAPSQDVTAAAVTAEAVPFPWQTRDIGSPSLAGDATYASGTFTLKGTGADIGGTSDQFRFVYQPLAGDGQIVARVTSLTNTNTLAKAGVMIPGGPCRQRQALQHLRNADKRRRRPLAHHRRRFDWLLPQEAALRRYG